MTNPLSNFFISNMYPNNIAFIAFPNGYDSNLNYSITSLDTTIATITEGNVINAIAIGSATITFSQNGYDISTTFTIKAVPVLVNADNKTIVYGDSIPNLTYNISQNIQDIIKSCSTEKIGISIVRQKIGYGINLQPRTRISDLNEINLSRFDSGNSTNPYLNIWVTNSNYTNYAVISITPNWFKEYTNASYDSLKNEDIFIYETIGIQLDSTGNYPNLVLGYQGTSWIASVSGVSGATAQLKLSDLHHLEIKAPPASWFGSIGGPYINGTGNGAPRELSTHNAYDFNWIFDNINNNRDGTLANYIISKATCNQSNLFYSYIIRNANNGIAPTILTQNVYNPSNISIGNNPISTLASISSHVGTYDITFDNTKFTSIYNLIFTKGTLTISKAIINVITENKSRIYGESNPTFTYTYSGLLNSDPESIISGLPSSTTTAILTSNVGDYQIITDIVNLSSTNYTFTKNDGILTVTKAPINVTATNKSKVYGSINPDFTYTISGYQNGENLDNVLGTPVLNSSVNLTSNVSTYPINISLPNINSSASILNNYDVVLNNEYLTVTKAILTLNISDKSRLYGQTEPAFTYTYSGYLNNDSDSNGIITGTPALSTTATIRSNIGTYPITANVSSLSSTNYTFTSANGNLSINKAIINVTTVNKSRIYGALNPTFTYTYSGLLNSDPETVISGAPSSTTTATFMSNIGNYEIITDIVSLSSTNYSFTKNDGILTVTKANILINAVNKSRLYGDSNPTFTYTYTGFLNSDDITNININRPLSSTTLANETSPIGNYDIIPNLLDLTSTNYTFTGSNAILTITQSILNVTAKNKSRMYGSSNPSFDYLITGYKNNDAISTESIINNINTINLSTPALINSAIGNYNIIPEVSGLSAHNYIFIGVNGTLTITPAILSLTAHNKSKNYGDNNPNLTYTITGYVLGESNLVTGIPDIYTTAIISSPVNGPNSDKTYPIIVTNHSLNAPNYSFNYIYGKLTIYPIAPTLNWNQLFTPPMLYGTKLNNLMLAVSKDKYSNVDNGIIIYNIVDKNNVQTQFSLGSIIPSTGTYTLYATLSTITNPNYLSSSLTINKILNVVSTDLNITWYNPVPISNTTPLSSVQLNAICNASTAIKNYTPSSGNTLPNGNQNLSVIFTTNDSGYTYSKIRTSVNINIVG